MTVERRRIHCWCCGWNDFRSCMIVARIFSALDVTGAWSFPGRCENGWLGDDVASCRRDDCVGGLATFQVERLVCQHPLLPKFSPSSGDCEPCGSLCCSLPCGVGAKCGGRTVPGYAQSCCATTCAASHLSIPVCRRLGSAACWPASSASRPQWRWVKNQTYIYETNSRCRF